MRALGPLEQRVMDIVWSAAHPLTVREVHGQLSKHGTLAYTTVMTVMDRLWRKEILRRQQRGRSFEYTPTSTEAEFVAGLMHELLARTRDRSHALAYFVRDLREADGPEILRLARRARRKTR